MKSAVFEAKPLSDAGRKALAEPGEGCAACPLVLVCRKCKKSEDVVKFLLRRTKASVRTVRCQKVCESPVAGLLVAGRMEWFERMDGAKALKTMAELLLQKPPSKLPKPLKKRRSRERSGCLPR
jgi:hypothetical protein